MALSAFLLNEKKLDKDSDVNTFEKTQKSTLYTIRQLKSFISQPAIYR
jgi:hypothetical protein